MTLREWCARLPEFHRVNHELDELEAKLAAAERDAGRYRWLRESGLAISWNAQVEYSPGYEHGVAVLMDAAIDFAMQPTTDASAQGEGNG